MKDIWNKQKEISKQNITFSLMESKNLTDYSFNNKDINYSKIGNAYTKFKCLNAVKCCSFNILSSNIDLISHKRILTNYYEIYRNENIDIFPNQNKRKIFKRK